MAFSAPALLKDKWPLLIKYGATKSCIYQQMSDTSYSGGSVIKTVISSTNIDIVFNKISSFLVDESTIRSIDKVALFPCLNLPVEPKINDLIIDSSLKEWEVKSVEEDPVDAHYELRVRPIT